MGIEASACAHNRHCIALHFFLLYETSCHCIELLWTSMKEQDSTKGSTTSVNVWSTAGIVTRQQLWMQRQSTHSRMLTTATTLKIWISEADELAGPSTYKYKYLASSLILSYLLIQIQIQAAETVICQCLVYPSTVYNLLLLYRTYCICIELPFDCWDCHATVIWYLLLYGTSSTCIELSISIFRLFCHCPLPIPATPFCCMKPPATA